MVTCSLLEGWRERARRASPRRRTETRPQSMHTARSTPPSSPHSAGNGGSRPALPCPTCAPSILSHVPAASAAMRAWRWSRRRTRACACAAAARPRRRAPAAPPRPRALLHLVAREELDLEVEQALACVGQHVGRRHVHRLRAARVGDERDRLVDGRVPPDRVDGEGRAKLLLLPLGHLDEHEADDLRLRREEWHELLVREPGVEVVKRHRLEHEVLAAVDPHVGRVLQPRCEHLGAGGQWTGWLPPCEAVVVDEVSLIVLVSWRWRLLARTRRQSSHARPEAR